MQAAFGQAEAACRVFLLYPYCGAITPYYEPALYFRWQSKQYTLPWKRPFLFQQKAATFGETGVLQSAQNSRLVCGVPEAVLERGSASFSDGLRPLQK